MTFTDRVALVYVFEIAFGLWYWLGIANDVGVKLLYLLPGMRYTIAFAAHFVL